MRKSVSNRKIIRVADANMRAEGFTVSAKVKNDCYKMLEGKVSADKLVEQYIARYKK